MNSAPEYQHTEAEVWDLFVNTILRPDLQVKLLSESLANGYRRRLWDVTKHVNLAFEVQARPERFPGQHAIARAYVRIDTPRLRKEIHAALHILEYGSRVMLRDFVIGSEATQQRLIQWVIRRGGIYHYRENRTPYWVELVAL